MAQTRRKRQTTHRGNAAGELQAARKRYGSVQEEAGTFAGLLDRVGMDLSVVMSKGDSGIVEWCREDAEQFAAEYEKALQDSELPGDLRPLL